MDFHISADDPVFDSIAFLRDEVTFDLLHMIRQGEDSVLLSDRQSWIIGTSSGPYPAWVWTAEDLAPDRETALFGAFREAFRASAEFSYVAKPAIAERIAEDCARFKMGQYRLTVELQAYHCPRLVPPRQTDGQMRRPSVKDKEVVASFLASFEEDCFGTQKKPGEMLEAAQRLIQNPGFFLLDAGGKTVAMANAGYRSPRHVRINSVYTVPDARRKGYAQDLVYRISDRMLREGLTPMLYTDLKNPASNKAYRNIGFTECGAAKEIKIEQPD